MKFRLSVSNAMVLFGVVAALCLAALLFTSGYALKQLRVGGPLYTQIKLGNDLIADILPPPEYVLEAYLEASFRRHFGVDVLEQGLHRGIPLFLRHSQKRRECVPSQQLLCLVILILYSVYAIARVVTESSL